MQSISTLGARTGGTKASHSASNSSKPSAAPPTLEARRALEATTLGRRRRSPTTTTISTPTKSKPCHEARGNKTRAKGPSKSRSATAPPAASHQEGRSETEYATGQGIEHPAEISSTEKSRLRIETQRLAIEIRTLAAQEAMVVHVGRRLRMEEVKILATVESGTYKHTDISCRV